MPRRLIADTEHSTLTELVLGLARSLGAHDEKRRRDAEQRLLALGPPAVEPLAALLGNPNTSGQRLASLLVRFGPVAVPATREVATQTTNPGQVWALWALGQLGSPDAVPELVAALGQQNSSVRHQAIRSLALIGSIAEPALIEALRNADPAVRRIAATSLAECGTPLSVPALRDVANDPDSGVRSATMTALARLADARVLELMVAHAGDRTSPHQLAAVDALARIDGPEAARAVCRLIPYSEATLWTRVLRAVEQIGSECIDPITTALLATTSIAQRRRYRDALACVGRSAVPRLIEILQSRSSRHRVDAAECLREIAGRSPTPDLRSALPVLRSRLTPFAFASGKEREIIAATIAAIEYSTSNNETLPLPAEPPRMRESLPLPHQHAGHAPDDLPLPAIATTEGA